MSQARRASGSPGASSSRTTDDAHPWGGGAGVPAPGASAGAGPPSCQAFSFRSVSATSPLPSATARPGVGPENGSGGLTSNTVPGSVAVPTAISARRKKHHVSTRQSQANSPSDLSDDGGEMDARQAPDQACEVGLQFEALPESQTVTERSCRAAKSRHRCSTSPRRRAPVGKTTARSAWCRCRGRTH